MKVKSIKELVELVNAGSFDMEEDTVSIENCEVGYVGEAKPKSGTTNGREWSFMQQFLVVKQGENTIGVNASEEYGKEIKGAIVSIVKAKVQEYEKDGKTCYSLQVKKGNLTITKMPEKTQTPSATQKGSGTATGEPVDPNVWTNKEIRKAREKALGCALAYRGLGIATGTIITEEQVINTAKYFEKYLYEIDGSTSAPPVKQEPKGDTKGTKPGYQPKPTPEEGKNPPVNNSAVSKPTVTKQEVTEETLPIQSQVDRLAAELIHKDIIKDWDTWLGILKKFGCDTYLKYIKSDITTKAKIYAELKVLENQGK